MAEEKVIHLDEVKLYRAKSRVLFVSDPRGAPPKFLNPTPVTNDEGLLIGWASLYLDGSWVFADLVLNYATPERLDIESGRKLYGWAWFGRPDGIIHSVILRPQQLYIDQEAVGEAIL